MAKVEVTAEQIELARQMYVQNVNRFNALTSHPRHEEIGNALSLLGKRLENDAKLVGQRYNTAKTLGIIKIFQQTSGKIAALEGQVGVATQPPPTVAPIVMREDPRDRPAEKTVWWMNPWYWGAGAVALLLLVALTSGGGGKDRE